MTYVSEWCRQQIAPALSPAARRHMSRVSPGVDPSTFRPDCGGTRIRREWGIDQQVPVVVCLARLVRRKGQDTLIQAWRGVLNENPEAVLLLVGDGPDDRRLRRIVDDEGVAGSVVFAGLADAVDVPAFLDAGDVFAMPCRTRRAGLEVEAWGIVFVEAQACGLPTVVGDSGGAPETVADPTYDVLVGGAPWQVSVAINQLLKRRHEGRRPTSPVHTWEAVCRQVERLLDGGRGAS
jgi:phosphatidylinositol alpha-1,6-mannosyltransferase